MCGLTVAHQICPRVALHDPAPVQERVEVRVLRLGPDGRRVEDQLRKVSSAA